MRRVARLALESGHSASAAELPLLEAGLIQSPVAANPLRAQLRDGLELQLRQGYDLVRARELEFAIRSKPLVPSGVDLAVSIHRSERLVDLGEERRLFLLHADADRLEHHRLLDHLELDALRFRLVDELRDCHGVSDHAKR